MNLLAFFLGLALGTGFWLGQQLWYAKQLRQMLRMLGTESSEIALPIISRLRRAIALSNQQRLDLEKEIHTWKHLLEVMPVGFVQVDEENQLVWCNQQGQKILQIEDSHPKERKFLIELVLSYELDRLIEQTRDRQKPEVQEWVFYPSAKNAETIQENQGLTLCGYSWPLPEGQVGVFLENQQPLLELAESRDRWVSDLAHELRTPLTSIQLAAEMLPERLQSPWKERAERLLGEINRLIQLVQDWLELTQMEVDLSKHLSRQPLELKSLIHKVWQALEPLSQEKQLTLAYSGDDSVFLEADKSRLHRVFLNIFDNSIRYSPLQETIQAVVTQTSKPEITSNSLKASSCICIDIIDSGPGFTESDLPHVFKRLYRGDRARARQTGESSNEGASPKSITNGTGLGLAIVEQIIQAHGGTINARNHPETGGAWLHIRLPSV